MILRWDSRAADGLAGASVGNEVRRAKDEQHGEEEKRAGSRRVEQCGCYTVGWKNV